MIETYWNDLDEKWQLMVIENYIEILKTGNPQSVEFMRGLAEEIGCGYLELCLFVSSVYNDFVLDLSDEML